MPTKIDENFGKAVREILDSRGLSTRGAKYKTGIDAGTILNMRNGEVPRKGVVIDFAQKFGENINKWLALAGYDPIPIKLILDGETTKESLLTFLHSEKENLSEEDLKEILAEVSKISKMRKSSN